MNRITSSNGSVGNRFSEVRNKFISDLSITDAKIYTGFTLSQLSKLYVHLCIPEQVIIEQRYNFGGEEAMLHYLYWNRNGGSKLQMSENAFGGDPRRFTYSICMIANHLYVMFYHKISGDSMRQWVHHVTLFRHAIWQRLLDGYTVEENVDTGDERSIRLAIPFESFRIFHSLMTLVLEQPLQVIVFNESMVSMMIFSDRFIQVILQVMG